MERRTEGRRREEGRINSRAAEYVVVLTLDYILTTWTGLGVSSACERVSEDE